MTEKEVIERGYAKEIYEFACKNPNANIELLTQALLESKRLPDRYSYTDYEEDDDYFEYPDFEDYEPVYYYYLFARDVKGANVSLLESQIDDFYDEIIYEFARDVEGANVESLSYKMEFSYPKYIYLFARDVENANIQILQDYLLNWLPEGYDTNFTEYVLKFAQEIEGANCPKMISDIELFLYNYNSSPKQTLPNIYINRLEELIKELKIIQNNKNDTNVLTKKYKPYM